MTFRIEQLAEGVTLHCGDCLDALEAIAPNSADSGVTDPPYGLGFMGKAWDHGVPGVLYWKQVLRVLKPGAHLLAFGGTRTYHRMVCAIEDAGFEIRDMVSWLYGSGFPKSLDVSKAIDKAAGAEREHIATGDPVKRMIPGADQHKAGWEKNNGRVYVPGESVPATDAAREWDGFGTALKPACEPIVLARKPLSESTVVANVLKWGTGVLNIDGCRVAASPDDVERAAVPQPMMRPDGKDSGHALGASVGRSGQRFDMSAGRWPANVIHDGSDEVVGAFPDTNAPGGYPADKAAFGYNGADRKQRGERFTFDDGGCAARFFYTAKADSDDRLGSKHPTVKPVDLIQYLVRLVTPPRGLVLDPFAGTGTLGEACIRERMRAILIEREPEYQDDIRRRMKLAMAGPTERKHVAAAAKHGIKPFEPGSLFG